MPTEEALGAFYEQHARDVWTYAYRVTGNAADADDIVQEAFLRLFKAERLPDGEEDLRRYMFRVAGNLIADRWRRRTRDERAALTAADAATAGGRDLDVVRTFSELKPRERALLWLAYVEGDSHTDIAESLRLGRDSVKVLLSRARSRLRDLLTARGMSKRVEK